MVSLKGPASRHQRCSLLAVSVLEVNEIVNEQSAGLNDHSGPNRFGSFPSTCTPSIAF